MFVDKVLESKIQDNLRLDQECSPETEVSEQPLLFQLLIPYKIAFS